MISADDSTREAPLVTIAIACFNAETTIGSAIASAQVQEWPTLEILVVDDASLDNSRAVIQEYAEHDDRIRVIHHDRNRGYAGVLNTILREARGQFIAVFDDDDVSTPSRIRKQWNRLTEYERTAKAGFVLCYSNRDVIVQSGERGAPVLAIGRVQREPYGPMVADFLLWHRERPGFTWGQFGSCTLLARRETLLGLGGLDENFRRGAEWDLAIRHGLRGGHFVAVNEALVTQRKTLTPDKAGRTDLEYALKLQKKYRPYLKVKHVTLASGALAHARFYYARRMRYRSRLYLALACLCSPFAVLPNELRKWNRRRRGRTA
jgi:glycosyltransferase involved in cell wall biosynthesis